MKRYFCLLIGLLFNMSLLQAQPYLFGTNPSGNGKIIRYDVSGNTLDMVSTFENDGLHPKQFSPLTRIAAGIFYGITASGGRYGNGVLFKLDSVSEKYTIVHDFGNEPSMYPADQPVLADDGTLYGVAFRTDSARTSLIYSFDPSNGAFNIEVEIQPFGVYTRERLARGDDGKLYGTASLQPGNYDHSRVFSFDPSNKSFQVYSNPDNPDGNYSIKNLVPGPYGKLYGNTASAYFPYGAILSFDPATKKAEVLKRLTAGDGERALMLTVYKDKLFGTTDEGGANGSGLIFSYDIISGDYNMIASLPVDNNYPFHDFATQIIINSDGIIHGMNSSGVFALDPVSRVYSQQVMSTQPVEGTSSFVVNDSGVIAIKAGTDQYQLIKRLNSPNGLKPQVTLYKAASGLLYGATTQGGLNNWGGLFSFNPMTSKLEMLHAFNRRIFDAYGPIVEMANGDVYFLVEYSEELYFGDGSLIRYRKSDKTMERVHDFRSSGIKADVRSLVQGDDGNLYGIATDATGQKKLLYRYSPADEHFETLYTYRFPTSELTKGPGNILYGLTREYTGGQWAIGLVGYNVVSNETAFYPYKFGNTYVSPGAGLALDSTGNLIFSMSGLVRFNVVTHEYAPIGSSGADYVTLPLLMTKDSTFYTSHVSNLEEHEPGGLDYIALLKESDMVEHVLTDMPGDIYFKASVLYSQPIVTRYGAITIADTSVNESDQQAVIRIHLSKPLDHTLRLYFRTRTGSATPFKPNRDFIRGKGFIYIKKGTVDKYIHITVLQDQLKEPDESFYMQILQTPHTSDSIQIEREQAMITILDVTPETKAISKPGNNKPQVDKAIYSHSRVDLDVHVSPNPSSSEFRIGWKGRSMPIQIWFVNSLGVVIERYYAVTPGKGLRIGSGWAPGVYFAVIQQGDQMRTLKLVKSNH